jgi:hypothetical protein
LWIMDEEVGAQGPAANVLESTVKSRAICVRARELVYIGQARERICPQEMHMLRKPRSKSIRLV